VRGSRLALIVVLLAIIVAGAWYFYGHRPLPTAGPTLTVYYAKLDGTTLGTWDVTVRAPAAGESSAEALHDLVTYAAVQAVAGPPPQTSAVRFPAGTRVRNVGVSGSTAVVDLSGEVASGVGSFEENGEFKGLVYTLTGIPSINAVQITVEGRTVETLTGGHLELDAPLRRSDW
jgi:spore germination protein GerM